MSFGGDSRSDSTSSNSTVDQTSSTVDNRVSESGAAVGGNVTTGSGDIAGDLIISTTDQGAIQGGVDIALESMRNVSSAIAGVQSVASDSIGQAYGLANEARQSETSAALNNFLKYGFWVALAGLGVWAYSRKPR